MENYYDTLEKELSTKKTLYYINYLESDICSEDEKLPDISYIGDLTDDEEDEEK